MRDCTHLVRPKGHGDNWCTKHGKVADCDNCEDRAKTLMYAKAYGMGGLSDREAARANRQLRKSLCLGTPGLGADSFQRQVDRYKELMTTDYSELEARMLASLGDDHEKINAWINGKWTCDRWYHRALRRLRDAWREHMPRWARRRPKLRNHQREINTAVQVGAFEVQVQERLLLDKLRRTYQALIVNKYCPECFQGEILAGPEAGGCQNVQCSKCNTGFWIDHASREGLRLDTGGIDGSEVVIDIERR